jgi:hypothetical protein
MHTAAYSWPVYMDTDAIIQVVVISKDPEFSDLTGVTEAYVPAAGVFVGEHPLLRRYAFHTTATAICVLMHAHSLCVSCTQSCHSYTLPPLS